MVGMFCWRTLVLIGGMGDGIGSYLGFRGKCCMWDRGSGGLVRVVSCSEADGSVWNGCCEADEKSGGDEGEFHFVVELRWRGLVFMYWWLELNATRKGGRKERVFV
jgi:hypothetical protein